MNDLLPLERTITLTDMVAYAGATWDWHPIHYDVSGTSLPGPVVDGQMLGALMAEQVLDHFGPRAFITSMSFRFRSMVFAGETVTITGTADTTNDDDDSAVVTQQVMVGDRLAAEGTVSVRL